MGYGWDLLTGQLGTPRAKSRGRDKKVAKPKGRRSGLRLYHAVLASLGCIGLGWLLSLSPDVIPGRHYWPLVLVAGVLTLGVTAVVWRHQRTSSRGFVHRWSTRSHRYDGVASIWQILWVSSAWAMRRKAKVLRPSLAKLSIWSRWRVPITEIATCIAHVGLLRVWHPVEDVSVRLGGARTGKTVSLCGIILDAPGAALVTSTRKDLLEITSQLRSQVGPVYVFNPGGVGNLPSTITFNPLSGCEDPMIAINGAKDLLSATARDPNDEARHWLDLAQSALSALMHAAVIGNATLWDVRAWVANPDAAAPEVMRLLSYSREKIFEFNAAQFFGYSDKTRSSVCSTITPALEWLANPAAEAAAQKGDFNVEELLANRGTVYLLGEDDTAAPLVTALTGRIAREARRIADLQPQGRLDPPLTMVLDEAALICPIPLDRWVADMGGRNITIHICAQARQQLKARWGETGAGTILSNAATLLIFGGARDPKDLDAYSMLTGDRDQVVETFDPEGNVTSRTTTQVPVMSPAQISQLPDFHAVIIRRGMRPSIGRPPKGWKRRDVRAAQRQARRGALTKWLQDWAASVRAFLVTYGQRWSVARREALQPVREKGVPRTPGTYRLRATSIPTDDRDVA